jgi:hypothetical protein
MLFAGPGPRIEWCSVLEAQYGFVGKRVATGACMQYGGRTVSFVVVAAGTKMLEYQSFLQWLLVFRIN